MVVIGESRDCTSRKASSMYRRPIAEDIYLQLVMRYTNSNNAAAAAESHKIGADSFIIETRIELFQIADRFSEWEKQMYRSGKSRCMRRRSC